MKHLHENWDSLSPNEKRTLRQQEIHEKWVAAGAIGYVLAVTGFGKTRLALLGIERCFEKNPMRRVNVVVPRIPLKEQWEAICESKGWKNVKVYVGKSYIGLPDYARTCDLLIVDEVHRFTNEESEIFSQVLDKTQKKWVLCLSATVNAEQRRFLHQRGINLIDRVTMEEATREVFVSDHRIYMVGLPMTEEDEKHLEKLNKRFNQTFKVFGFDLDYMFHLMSKQGARARMEEEQRHGWEEGACFGVVRKGLQAMRERKDFLQKTQSKIDAAVRAVSWFPKKKIITFSEYTDFVDQLTETMGRRAMSYHSNMATQYFDEDGKRMKIDAPTYKKLRKEGRKISRKGKQTLMKEVLDTFKRSKNRICNTAKAVDEGVDIDGIEVALLLSYSSTPRQIIQRIGRAIRYFSGKKAFIIVFYVHSEKFRTQELRWLKKAATELHNPIWVDGMDELEQLIEDYKNE